MKILMVAGESSGDTHGAALMSELNQIASQLTFYGIGGPLMLKQGINAYYTIDSLRVHGLVELIPHLPRLYKILWHLRDSLSIEKPDFAILVDYPGFNLKLAAHLEKQNIPVIWYCSPQIWAWRKGRIHKIAQFVDKIIVLFPFEEQIYRNVGVNASFLGHPRVEDTVSSEQIDHFKQKYHQDTTKPMITLAIGSRPSEIKFHLPIVLEALALLKVQGFEANYILPVADSLDFEWVQAQVQESTVPVNTLQNTFLESIHAADAAIVASGTATLQTGLALTPFILIYKVAPLTFWLAKKMAQIPYLGIVNILAQRFIVPELLQNDLTPPRVAQEILRILDDPAHRKQMIENLSSIRSQLGEPGAYQRAAQCIQEFMLKHKK